MAIGKRLVFQLGCVVSALLLLVCVAATASFYFANSGQQLCVPRLSIRCHESDCGRFFQRCGSDQLLAVPDHQVCYKGSLLPASSTDLHSCSRSSNHSSSSGPSHNNKNAQSGLGACDCGLCTYPQSCQCRCTQGVNVATPVTCGSERYASLAVAMSQGVPEAHCSQPAKLPMWETMLEALERRYSELSGRSWSLQDFFAASFTFQPPSIADDLRGACFCYISPSCSRKCQGRL